jgi:polyisoprenoid-binding protein YceI
MSRRPGLLALACMLAGSAAIAVRGGAPGASFTADPLQSRLEFVGTQAGAPFRASFRRFTAAIDFSPQAPAGAHFDVVIEQASVDSQDGDRDAAIRGADLFDVAHWPTAHYVTQSVAKSAAGFHATGSLTLHGVTRDVPIDFQFTPTPAGAKLEGTASLKRLDFGVGQGDWKSTEGVGDEVRVEFSLVLVPRS